MLTAESFIEWANSTDGKPRFLFGDIINGNCGMTAEEVLLQVQENPHASDPQKGFFYAYEIDTENVVEEFSIEEIGDMMGIEIEKL